MTACNFIPINPPSVSRPTNQLLDALRSVGAYTEAGDGPWINGIQFQPTPLGGGGIYNVLCDSETCLEKTHLGFHDPVKFRPYFIYTSATCGSFSDKALVTDNANSAFDASIDVILAAELWAGRGTQAALAIATDQGFTCQDGSDYFANPYLASPDQLFPTGTDEEDWTTAEAIFPERAIALILSRIPFGGVLHVSPSLASELVVRDLIVPDGPAFRTAVGNHLVIAAPGYTGTSPANTKYDDVEWIYVTGGVAGIAGDTEIYPSFERETNRYETLKETTALVYFDTNIRFGVPVLLSCACGDTSPDFSEDGDPATDIFNDHLYACLSLAGADTNGGPIDPDAYVGFFTDTNNVDVFAESS